MEEYLASCEAGQPLAADELAARYPELAGQVADCLASLEFIRAQPAGQRAGCLPCRLPRFRRAAGGATRRLPHPPRDRPRRHGRRLRGRADFARAARGLKVLPFAAVLDTKQLARFKNEAQAAATPRPSAHRRCLRRRLRARRPLLRDALHRRLHAGRRDRRQLRVGSQETGVASAARRDWRRRAGPNSEAASPHDTSPLAVLSTLGIGDTSLRSPQYYRVVAALSRTPPKPCTTPTNRAIIHRDIKPGNLMLDDRGKLWITDFGLAHIETDARR